MLLGTLAHAQALRPDIVEAIKMLPLPEFKAVAADLYEDARKEASHAPWHSAKKGSFQLHFYSKDDVQMAFVVYDGSITLSKLPFLSGGIWKRLGDAEFATPIFSLSISQGQSVSAEGNTPAMLSQALKATYPGMSSFSVDPGVQVFTRASIQGVVGSAIRVMGAPASNFWLRAGMTGEAPGRNVDRKSVV